MTKRILLPLLIITIPMILIYGFYIDTYPFQILLYAAFIIPMLVLSTILTPFIYWIEKKSIVISVIILVFILLFLNVIEENEKELTNFENWKFYNHQTIILNGLDKFIGKYYISIVVFLCLLSFNFIVGIIMELYEIIIQKLNSKTNG